MRESPKLNKGCNLLTKSLSVWTRCELPRTGFNCSPQKSAYRTDRCRGSPWALLSACPLYLRNRSPLFRYFLGDLFLYIGMQQALPQARDDNFGPADWDMAANS